MATQAQIDANRLNALRSTGPRSAEGKAASRFNSLKLGITAQSLIIPGEDFAELEALSNGYHEQFHPANPVEAQFVDALVRAEWTKRRLSRIEAAAINGMLREEDAPNALGLAILRDAEGPNALEKIYRQQNAQERAYFKALASLRNLQAERRREEFEQAMLERDAAPARPAPSPAAAPPDWVRSANPPAAAEIRRPIAPIDPKKDDRALRL